MNRSDQVSFVLIFLIGECLWALLRPLWLADLHAFQQALEDTDCYPFRICYETGEFSRFWMEAPWVEEREYEEEFA